MPRSSTARKLSPPPSCDLLPDSHERRRRRDDEDGGGPITQRMRPCDLAAALQRVCADFEDYDREARETTATATPAEVFSILSKPRRELRFDLISDDDDGPAETTLMVDAKVNERFAREQERNEVERLRWQRTKCDATRAAQMGARSRREDQKPFNPDDEITVDAPVPELPEGTPSPIEESGVQSSPSAPSAPPLELDLDLDVPDALPQLAPVLAPDSTELPYVSSSSASAAAQGATDAARELSMPAAISGIRLSVTPQMKQSIREAREAARDARTAQTRTRVIVALIWLVAVGIAAMLAFVASAP